MKNNKRIIGIFVSLSLMLGTSNIAFAAVDVSGNAVPSKELAYVKPVFVVELDGKPQIFKDAKGQRVYPVVYNGSTYLPVRAISALMDEDIAWDNHSRTVYIGKTLNNPNKSRIKRDNEVNTAAQSVEKDRYIQPTWKSASVTVEVRPDISILYDFEEQYFTDEGKNRVYPILYGGSTYLPVRAASELMGEPISWDNVTKTIKIGRDKAENEEKVEMTPTTKKLNIEFEDAVELYDQATEKIQGIKKCTDSAVLVMIANSISADVQAAEKQTISITTMRKSMMTNEEEVAYNALYDFARMSENYLLVLENIAYLAASKEDYSMLAETFLNMALESQNKMNLARDCIKILPQ